MPFFIRGRRSAKPLEKSKTKKLVKSRREHAGKHDIKHGEKRNRSRISDEEITSDEDEELVDKFRNKKSDNVRYLEQEEETAQEKKVRLAKQYLEEIRQRKQEELDGEDLEDAVGDQLREEVLDASGKLQKAVADTLVCPNDEAILFLKCRHNKRSLTCLTISSDDKLVFTGSKDCNIVKWSLNGERLGIIFGGHKGLTISKECHLSHILCLAISTDTNFLASGDVDGDIRIWNPADLSHLKTFNKHRDSVSSLAFRWRTHSLFSASHDRMVMLWDLDSMTFVENMGGHQDCITGLDVLSRESCITSGGRDEMVIVNLIAEDKQLRFSANQGSIDGVKLLNEKAFVTCGQDGSLATWVTAKKSPKSYIREAHGKDSESGVPYWVTSLATIHNTDVVASGSMNGFINLWKVDVTSMSLTKLFAVSVDGVINGLHFTSSGSHLLAVVGKEHKLGRWYTKKTAKNALVIISLSRKS